MKWTFRIATLFGTEVRIHATFALLLGYAAWIGIGLGNGWSGVFDTVLLVCAMFVCVLMHEYGHVLSARRYGIHTPDITLLPIGGVARMERMPRNPLEELVVALCGPLVNVLIAGGIFIGLGLTQGFDWSLFMSPGFFWDTLMVWNLMMVAFNLIPAFPMDGGRVLRALLAMMIPDYAKATRWAANIGQAIAVIAALAMVMTGWVEQNPFTLLITFFVFFAAGREANTVSTMEALGQFSVSDAMLVEFHRLSPDSALREAVDLLLAGSQTDFPVVDDEGRVVGLLTRTRLIEGLALHGMVGKVSAMMNFCSPSDVMSPRTSLAVAAHRLQAGQSPILPVIDPVHDRLVGLVSSDNLSEMIMVRAAIMKHVQR
jgi:Zn-dependent protease